MTGLRLTLRSALFYARSNLCVLAGVALATAVLVGALLVGDSIRYSLVQSALLRLGTIHYALNLQGRYFNDDLASRLQTETSTTIAPVLLLKGVAMMARPDSERDESAQVNGVQIVGVDERFRQLAGHSRSRLSVDGVSLNAKLASALGVKPGDHISLRFSRPSLLPHDAPLASRKGDDSIRLSLPVAGIVGDDELGRFSLNANQAVPFNVFVDLGTLQKAANLEHRANLLLAEGSSRLSTAALDVAVRKVWRLDDAGLNWRAIASKSLYQLESERVILDPAVEKAMAGISNAVGTLTYLVNSISAQNGHSTPYSFVMAVSRLPLEMRDDEILVNQWLADQLLLHHGDRVSMAFFQYSAWGRFMETSRVFTVKGVVGMDALAEERELAPRFPGLTDAGRCADWDIGMPLDEAKMKDQANEAYWNEYRDTPKAIVTLKAGQEMWANRFGALTAVRFKAEPKGRQVLEETVRQALAPASLGFAFLPVREVALKAVSESMDFGQLFLGMSLFVIVAALVLTAMLSAFGIQQRSKEIGLLLAVGFRPGQVRWLLIRESIWVAGAGVLIGAVLGLGYTQLLIFGLAHFWKGAVASASIQFHAEPLSIGVGALAGFLMAMTALVISLLRQTGRPARELMAGTPALKGRASSPGEPWFVLPWLGLLVSAALIVLGIFKSLPDPVEIFFSAGSLLLVSLMGLIRLYFVRLARMRGRLTLVSLSFRNVGRQRARSLTVTGLLACGCFLVFAVSSMQEDLVKHAAERQSGTGGFALFGESALPVYDDLTTPVGLKKLRLDHAVVPEGLRIVPIKVHDGDDASCLNLNRAQTPRLLGVEPREFISRGAFCSGRAGLNEWTWLESPLPDGCVPGLVGDANTAQWGLQKKVGRDNGDILSYRDEQGGVFKVRLVGALPLRLSVFQGSILIPASSFSEQYPSESGFRMFLFDVPSGSERAVQQGLSHRLSKYGVNVISTVDRLKEFYAVESTYMAMFLVLGGMGLLLGSLGMGIVVVKTIGERRPELALLKAVGYSDAAIHAIIGREYRLILVLGLGAGVISAAAAMWPNLTGPGVDLPILTMISFLGGIILFHLLWIQLAIRWALRFPLLSALRNQ